MVGLGFLRRCPPSPLLTRVGIKVCTHVMPVEVLRFSNHVHGLSATSYNDSVLLNIGIMLNTHIFLVNISTNRTRSLLSVVTSV